MPVRVAHAVIVLELTFRPVQASRDKILLDGHTYDDDGDEDEVFALKGLESDGNDDEDEDDEEGEENYGEDDLAPTSALPKARKRENKKKKGKQESSEDEVEDEEETWGSGKAAYYSSNATQLDSDDEEGYELEEQEARRLQKKALEGMNDDDFGLNDKHEIPRTDDAVK